MNIEGLLFKRVHVWVVLLLAILACLGTFAFGVLVADDVSGRNRYGALSNVAGEISNVPETVAYLRRAHRALEALNGHRFPDQYGWSRPEGANKVPGYLLLSRHDGDLTRHVLELVDLSTLEPVHRWMPDAQDILKDVPRTSKVASFSRWNREKYRVIHPVLLEDGSVIVKDHQSPLARLDACSNIMWRNFETMFHHSTEPVGDGTYWIPTTIEPNSFPSGDSFIDDALTLVNDEGEILLTHSVAQAMMDAGLTHLIFSAGGYNKDPIHLNDIEPVLEDGPFWKKGDVFLSMRPTSMVMLYRPSTREVVWFQQGPWMAQHDVDIVDDHTISIFSNNAYDRGKGGYVEGVSEIMYFDFETGEVTSPYRAAMENARVVTLSEGLSDAIPGGQYMVEEENAGRILIVNDAGGVDAEFVNRASNGNTYRLGWSRYIGQQEGDALAEILRTTNCPG